MTPRPDTGDAGSLPIVLLAAIILAGVIAALFTVVSTGTDTARIDRDRAVGFHVADAGIQESYVNLLDVDEGALESGEPGFNDAPCDDPVGTSNVASGTCESVLPDGSTVQWEYQQTAPGARQWVVVSRASFGRSDQVLRAQIGQNPLFAAMLVALDDITLNGLGTAVSGSTCQLPKQIGLAAAGQITINGPGGVCLSGVTTHPPNNPPDLGSEGDDIPVENVEQELSITDEASLAFAPGAECDRDGDDLVAEAPLQRGEKYCVGSLTVQDIVVAGAGDEPVTIYVQNDAEPTQFATWNAAGEAKDLQIFIGGGQGFTLGPNRIVRASIVAPNGPCTTNGFGSTGFFAGAMACKDIVINGNLDYDGTPLSIFQGDFAIRLFSQEARGYVEPTS